MDGPVLDLLIAIGDPAQRSDVAVALAKRLGIERLVVLIDDPALGVLVPAPGFAQTIDGGASWRRFVAGCTAPGRSEGHVELPKGSDRPAIALRHGPLAVVLVGGAPDAADLHCIERLLPLLAALLQTEQLALLDGAQANEARDAASRAQTLAGALESARAEAARLNARLHEADRRKDEFLAMLAHELRNPLAPIVMAMEMLRRPNVAVELRERQLAMMSRQVLQMSRLVEDLLDVSRVSRGRIELRRQRLAVRAVVGDAVEASRPLLAARHHQLTVFNTPEPLAVDGDPIRLTQVLTNLLHNAAKFTDSGGRLTLRTSRQGGDVVISLQDSGIGIAADMLPRIFDLFAQVPVTIDRSRGGLGIGLTLVRTLVELHGGHVSAESPGIGQGTTFSIRLPLAVDAGAAVVGTSTAFHGATTSPVRVLVVDDNEDAADSVAEILRLQGHEAVAAYHGDTALQLAAEFDADLILLDLGLPGIDGFELARRLRGIVRAETRLIALTGYGSDADRRRSREAGFDDHLVKPVLGETLHTLAEGVAAGMHRTA